MGKSTSISDLFLYIFAFYIGTDKAILKNCRSVIDSSKGTNALMSWGPSFVIIEEVAHNFRKRESKQGGRGGTALEAVCCPPHAF